MESLDTDSTKAWADQLPDPYPLSNQSCDAYEYLQSLNQLIKNLDKKCQSSKRFLETLSSIIQLINKDDIIVRKIVEIIDRYRAGEEIDFGSVDEIFDPLLTRTSLSSKFVELLSNTTVTRYLDGIGNINDKTAVENATFFNTAVASDKNLFDKIDLPAELRNDVLSRIVEQLLKDLNDEKFADLIRDKKHDQLRSIYQLHKIGSSTHVIQSLWKGYIEAHVDKFFQEELDLDCFLQLRHECNVIVKECFEDDESMSKQLFKSAALYRRPVYPPPQCGRGIDDRPIPITEICIDYVHKKLSKAAKHQPSTEDLESWVQNLVEMLPYLDMPRFQKLYKRYLLRRFVKYTSLAIDAERLMCSKIPDFESMGDIGVDLELHQKTDEQWKEYLATNQIDLGMEFQVKRINEKWCKAEYAYDFVFPQQFTHAIQAYRRFASAGQEGQHMRRYIQFNGYTKYSTCEVVGNFTGGSKTLIVTIEQAVVLLLFNDHNTLSFDDIKYETRIGVDRAKDILDPIIRSGMIVPEHCSNIDDVDVVRYGKEFTSPQTKFVFTSFKRKKPVQTRETDNMSLLIQATIIRVIKRERLISEKDLVQQVRSLTVTRIKSIHRTSKDLAASVDFTAYLKTASPRDAPNMEREDLIKKGYILQSGQ